MSFNDILVLPILNRYMAVFIILNILKTIYLLLDIMYSSPNKMDTSIESFPTAFAISWGQVKLIQGFWLIDHSDYEVSVFIHLECKPLLMLENICPYFM